jgi:hypothetical protein
MSKQPSRPSSSGKRRPQARKGRTAMAAKKGRRDLTTWIVAGIIIVVGGAFLFAVSSSKKDTTNGTGSTKAPADLVSKVTSVPDSVVTQVGSGTVTGMPTYLGGPMTTDTGKADGKPLITYIGAEYCPYCATERWAMVNALSRFGTFTNLGVTSSSSTDVYPSTPTFSFHGSNYTSKYVAFHPVEQYTNIQQGSSPSGYSPLDKTTTDQDQLMAKYDAPPYVQSSDQGAIPFIDFANMYLISGATYSPTVLQGKSASSIAAALHDPSSEIAKGAIGAANTMTATICKLTNNQPASACTPAIQAIEAKLPTK